MSVLQKQCREFVENVQAVMAVWPAGDPRGQRNIDFAELVSTMTELTAPLGVSASVGAVRAIATGRAFDVLTKKGFDTWVISDFTEHVKSIGVGGDFVTIQPMAAGQWPVAA